MQQLTRPRHFVLRSGAVFALAAALFSFASSPAAHAAGASVTIAPATLALAPGASGEVAIMLTSDTPTRGMQLGLKYDPSVVTIDRVSDGTFYQSWAQGAGVKAQSMIPFKADNNKGVVSVGAIVVLGGQAGQGPTGSGPVLKVSLTAPPNANGQTTLQLTDVLVTDASAPPREIAGVTSAGATIGVGAGLDASTLQAPGATDATHVQAAPVPDIQIGSNAGVASSAPPPATVAPPPQAPAQPAAAQSNAQAAPAQAAATPVVAGAQQAQNTSAAAQQNQAAAPPAANPAPAANTGAAQPAFQATTDVNQASSTGQSQVGPNSAGTAPVNQTSAVDAIPPTRVANFGTAAQTQTQPQAQAAQQQVNQAPLTPRPVMTPTRPPASAASAVAPPRGSTGLFIPWEVLAGVGGGIVAAGLTLYAVSARRTELQK